MKAVAGAIALFSQNDIATLEKQGHYDLLINGETLQITVGEVEITYEDIPGWTVASKGPLTIALDTTLTPELLEEGMARELINRLQRLRKDKGFELTDRIGVKLTDNQVLKKTIINYNNYIWIIPFILKTYIYSTYFLFPDSDDRRSFEII